MVNLKQVDYIFYTKERRVYEETECFFSDCIDDVIWFKYKHYECKSGNDNL